MLRHPLVSALFDVDSSTPSKQLEQARQVVFQSSDIPAIVLILPPAELLLQQVNAETLLLDDYLLAHVAILTSEFDLVGLDAVSSRMRVRGKELVSLQPNRPCVKITNGYIWQPGLDIANFSASYMVLEVNGLILTQKNVKPANWFNKRRSMPLDGAYNYQTLTTEEMDKLKNTKTIKTDKNEAKDDGKDQGEEEEKKKFDKYRNAYRIDYLLACMQLDANSPSELAHRFQTTVNSVSKFLNEDPAFSLNDCRELALKYAELKLSKPVLARLDQLMQVKTPLVTIQSSAQWLDLSQVDIPPFKAVETSKFERAVQNAALNLNRLVKAYDSHSIKQILTTSLEFLASKELGTVSADALIGLFMLTLMRTSKEAGKIVERQLYYVSNFGRQVSGQTEYMLMLAESVLQQLRIELGRLKHISTLNYEFWTAVETNNWPRIAEIYAENANSLLSRKNGKSALFLALENGNFRTFEFLITNFPQIYGLEFIVSDKDLTDRTLLMLALNSADSALLILRHLKSKSKSESKQGADVEGVVNEYINYVDLANNNVGHYLALQTNVPAVFQLAQELENDVDWCLKNLNGNTPLLLFAKNGYDLGVKLMTNFYNHIDADGNSLLHIAAFNGDLHAVQSLIANPTTNVNFVNQRGESPLAVTDLNNDVAKILISNGANPWLDVGLPLNTEIMHSRIQHGLYVQKSTTNKFTLTPLDTITSSSAKNAGLEFELNDFTALYTHIAKHFPYSWKPSVLNSYIASNSSNTLQLVTTLSTPQQTASNKLNSNRKDGMAGIFENSVYEDDITRLMFYLRAIEFHGTYSKVLPCFINQEPLPEAEEEKTSSESVQSVVAFCQIGQEQLKAMNTALNTVCRQFSQLHTVSTELQLSSKSCDRQVHQLQPKFGDSSILNEPIPRTLIWRTVSLNICMLSTCVLDVYKELNRPALLITKLQETQRLLLEYKHRHELMLKNRHSWLPSLEDKRAADIVLMQEEMKQLENQIESMQTEVRKTHFLLAAELSAFNTYFELELLQQMRSFALYSLNTAKTRLSHLTEYKHKFLAN